LSSQSLDLKFIRYIDISPSSGYSCNITCVKDFYNFKDPNLHWKYNNVKIMFN